MNSLDIALVIIILIGAYSGYKHGFLMSLISLVAIILGVLGGFALMGKAMVLLSGKFNADTKMLPYISFAVVFMLITIAVTLMGRAIKSSLDDSFLGKVDQAAGAALGLVKIIFMVSVLIWILNSLKISPFAAWVETSWLYPKVAVFAPKVTRWISHFIPFFKNIF